jgi:hypothetical protein
MIPLKKVRESPTEIGIRGRSGDRPPASKITTRFGALTFWASMAAAQGAPVPTATVVPSLRNLAAVHIIISILLYSDVILLYLRFIFGCANPDILFRLFSLIHIFVGKIAKKYYLSIHKRFEFSEFL